ncbi:unnamed protein product [Withania somnifera]
MAPKNQNKPPLRTLSTPSNGNYTEGEVSVDKRRRIGNPKMPSTGTGVRTSQALAVVNGVADLPPASGPPSSEGSDSGIVEFSKEDIEALLTEKLKTKNKYNIKEKCDLMSEYIRRLKLCVKWFQKLEGNYVTEKESLNGLLESAEKKCNEMEMLMKVKEEELNSIITELRKSIEALQEKFSKEESAKLEAVNSYTREKHARDMAEKLQASLFEELKIAQQDNASANQKIQSLNNMYKGLQEYNRNLQDYNSRLQKDLGTVNETLKCVEKEKAAVFENLSGLRGHYTSLQEQIASSRAVQDEAVKQKEALASEVGFLRGDLQKIRDDRDQQSLQVQVLTAEVTKYKECTGKSVAELEGMMIKTDQLEETCLFQCEQVKRLQQQLAFAEKRLEMSSMSAVKAKEEYEEQKNVIIGLQNRLDDAETKIVEGEKLRKKLHNTILELKGNIRVFCRVRPLLYDDTVRAETKVISFPTSTEAKGRGVDLIHNGQKQSFTFDKVFMPEASQEDVFVEISQLVQSALDGYKVCIFAYGQTGSGKTHTMVGKPDTDNQKGLIPRSLEQVFETRRSLQNQGWNYKMQVSMLEIYNETIRDLLSPSNSSSSDAPRPENVGKQYAIKHDVNGNTHVSDLTIVDVHCYNQVSKLFGLAAESRSVGKTRMNQRSSRSHFVFTLRIYGVNEAINKSLSSLSDVIFALAKKEEHVPFRNSKLTYLLRACLGGNSKTLMFVNVSRILHTWVNLSCSLRFAARVNACEIGIPRRQTSLRPIDSRLSIG